MGDFTKRTPSTTRTSNGSLLTDADAQYMIQNKIFQLGNFVEL